MKKILMSLTVVATLFLACQGETTITGTVTHSETGRPIPGAWVYDPTMDTAAVEEEPSPQITLYGMRPNKQIVTTDSAGRYVLEQVSARKHTIFFAADEFESAEIISEGRDTVLDVQLEPLPIEIIY